MRIKFGTQLISQDTYVNLLKLKLISVKTDLYLRIKYLIKMKKKRSSSSLEKEPQLLKRKDKEFMEIFAHSVGLCTLFHLCYSIDEHRHRCDGPLISRLLAVHPH